MAKKQRTQMEESDAADARVIPFFHQQIEAATKQSTISIGGGDDNAGSAELASRDAVEGISTRAVKLSGKEATTAIDSRVLVESEARIGAADQLITTIGDGETGTANVEQHEILKKNTKNSAAVAAEVAMAGDEVSVCVVSANVSAKTALGEVNGALVQVAQQKTSALEGKKAFRLPNKIDELLPYGGGNLEVKTPKRKNFGPEGAKGDEEHTEAMMQLSLTGFSSSHVQDRTIKNRFADVGLFGDWLEQNNYGKYIDWKAGSDASKPRVPFAIELNGAPRIPSKAALMEYVLAMATGDVESRPKGGRPEYRMKDHKAGLWGKRAGEFMTAENMKAFGWGAFADKPFRFRRIECQMNHIRWFYETILEKQNGGPRNPASAPEVKALMKALSYLMGLRRAYVPKALTADIVKGLCGVVRADDVDEMTAIFAIVADLV